MTELERQQSSFQAWLETCLSRDEDADIAKRLRQEAQTHFESLCKPSTSRSTSSNKSSPSKSSTVEQDLSNASSATSNGAIANLVSTLGPAFSQNDTSILHKMATRERAVNCLIGALNGCNSLTYGVRQGVGTFIVELCRAEHNSDGMMITMDNSNAFVDGANLTSEEITQQLEAMDKEQTQRMKGQQTSSAEDIRDGAIEGLTALIKSRLDVFPTHQSISSSPARDAVEVVYQSMELRMQFAIQGLNNRCESFDSSNNYSNGDDYDAGMKMEGLSQLTRVKRSLCFTLLEGALDGLLSDKQQLGQLLKRHDSKNAEDMETQFPRTLSREIFKFASMIPSCLHGETDPRCLLQLLRLLNKMQQILLPIFSGTPDAMKFPTVEVFDAVAPYYPVHFQPPRNDPFGITREMLQNALMAVLCERGAAYSTKIEISNNDSNEDESMTVLSARMFLERLDPPKFTNDYDPPPESEEEDKFEALRDLSTLLLSPTSPTADGRITVQFVSELSSSLARAHEDAVSSDKSTDTNSLARRIRKFAASFANKLAPLNTNNDDMNRKHTTLLWEAFISDATRKLAVNLSSSPQSMHGRSSTAYLAALAAEGGLQTLRKILNVAMPRFLDLLSNLEDSTSADDEKMAAAIRGIAAFMSSCFVAMKLWGENNQGVQVHPHPLSPFISKILSRIAVVLKGERSNGALALASAGAFESALTSTDLSGAEEEDMNTINELLEYMSTVILEDVGNGYFESLSMDEDNLRRWYESCARALGASIAVGFNKAEDMRSHSRQKLESTAQSLLPKFLASSIQTSGSTSKPKLERYDWIVLAGACANGSPNVSEQIVSQLLSSTMNDLRQNIDVGRNTSQFRCWPLIALAYLIRHGGPNVGRILHDGSSPSSPLDIINELCLPMNQDSSESSKNNVQRQLPIGMSHLQLPESLAKDEEMKNATIQRAYCVLPYLIETYVCPSSHMSCDSLVEFVDQILPPLSELDEVKLYVAFPLLSAALNGQKDAWKVISPATIERLMSMTTYLAQFSISADHDPPSRSAAASCLFAILAHDSSGDNIKHLLDVVIYPTLTESVGRLKQNIGNMPDASDICQPPCFTNVEAALNLMALVGSAAACSGGPCSKIADEIASCLIKVACTGTSPVFSFESPHIEAQKNPISDVNSLVFMLPAAAYGSMLTVKNGGALWRQRIIHKTLPILMTALQEQSTSRNPPPLGSLVVVAHILCSVSRTHLGESKIQQMIPTLIAGLVYFSKNLHLITADDEGMIGEDALSIILGSLIKLLQISPQDITKFIGVIIPSLLLISTCNTSCIQMQLIALQCLEIIALSPNARNASLREKDQVTKALSAVVDHPSKIIRSGIVQVRNVWFTL